MGGGSGDVTPDSPVLDSPGLLSRMERSHTKTRFRGERRVELHFVEEGRDETFEYREEIGCDGDGRYAIHMLEVLEGPDDTDLFMMLHDNRQSFTFNFRDFRVTDRQLLRQNYSIAHLSDSETVAGVPCLLLRVERLSNPLGTYFRVWIEPDSGLVLRWEHRDRNAVLLGEMVFESVDFTPDLSNFILRRGNFDGRSIDIDGNIAAQVGFEVLTPEMLPAGFRLESGRVVTDSMGANWFRRIYTDGVSRMAILHRKPESDIDNSHGGHLGTVQSMQVGQWNVVTGRLAGWSLIVMGQLDPDELYQTIQSAF